LRKLLLDYGAEEEPRPMDELTKLFDDNNLEELEKRPKEKRALEKQDAAFWGEGILAGPANRGDRPMIELLVRYGARVPDVSKWGRYYYFKHTEIAKFLPENEVMMAGTVQRMQRGALHRLLISNTYGS
jgi:hypothetical protein